MSRTTLGLLAIGVGVVAAAGARVASSAAQVVPADLVIQNGRIVTVDTRVPEAQALAARDGKIVAIGTTADLARYLGPSTQVIDLHGQLAIPGFIEGHAHFTGIGENRINLDLMSTKSWDEIVQMVAQAVEKAKPGQWIIGRGWHQEKWTSSTAAERRGISDPRVARQGLAEQPGGADARERARVIRQREGHGALEHHEGHGQSERRRDSEGRGRQSDGPAA